MHISIFITIIVSPYVSSAILGELDVPIGTPKGYPSCTNLNSSQGYCDIPGQYKPYQGKNFYPADVAYTLVPDFATCRDWAEGGLNNVSIQYNETSQLCNLFISGAASFDPSYGELSNSTDTTLWRYDCFSCPTTECTIPVGTNYLINGDFETNSVYAGPWYVTGPAEVASPGSNSSNCLRFGPQRHGGDRNPFISQSIPSCTGALFLVRFDYKVGKIQDSLTSRPQIYYDIHSSSSTGVLGYLGLFDTHGSWKTQTDYFIAEAPFTPFMLGVTTGKSNNSYYAPAVYVDNLDIHEIPVQTITNDPSIIANGGFESGKLGPWKTFFTNGKPGPKYGVRSPGLAGSSYALEIAKIGDPDTEDSLVLTQKITLKAGTPYFFSMDVINAAPLVYVDVFEFAFYNFPQPSNTSGYITWRAAFVSQKENSTISLTINKISYKQNITVDNISIEELVN